MRAAAAGTGCEDGADEPMSAAAQIAAGPRGRRRRRAGLRLAGRAQRLPAAALRRPGAAPGARPLRRAPPVRPAPAAAPEKQAALAARPGRARARPGRQHRRQPRPPEAVPAAPATRWGRCWSARATFVLGLQRLLRPQARRTPPATSARPREARADRAPARPGDLRQGPGAGWVDLTNSRGRAHAGRPRPRARRPRRPPHRERPLRRGGRAGRSPAPASRRAWRTRRTRASWTR